jgi:dihydrofolate reductase
MPKVIADISMSLDGFVTGDGADEQHGLGDAPELHTWVMQQDAVDTEILEQSTAQNGAVLMGRRLFDVVNGPDGWNEEMEYAPIRRNAAVLRRHPVAAAIMGGGDANSSTTEPDAMTTARVRPDSTATARDADRA